MSQPATWLLLPATSKCRGNISLSCRGETRIAAAVAWGNPENSRCGLRVVTGQSTCPGPTQAGARMAVGAWYLAPGGRKCPCPPVDLAWAVFTRSAYRHDHTARLIKHAGVGFRVAPGGPAVAGRRTNAPPRRTGVPAAGEPKIRPRVRFFFRPRYRSPGGGLLIFCSEETEK